MKGNLDTGKAALQEALKLNPQANSIEFLRHRDRSCNASQECSAMREETLFAGLRRLGFPEK